MKNEKPTNSNRRDFIKKTSLASAGVLGLGSVQAQTSNLLTNNLPMNLPKDMTILFQGDSITDGGRKRDGYYANHTWGGLGSSYVLPIISQLMGTNPTANLRCYNRAISGDKVPQLANRWVEDCMQIRPDVLSILVGVNDFWHTLDFDYKGTAQSYEADLRKLFDRTLKELPDLKIMVGQPFVVKGGSAIVEEKWFPAFMAYQEAAKKVATDYNAHWIPFQKVFDDALKIAPVEYWCADGVHPSLGGGHLMAQAWLEVFGEMMK